MIVSSTGTSLAARPGGTGGWPAGGFAIAEEPAERSIHCAIIWECLRDLRIEDDYVRCLSDSPRVLPTSQAPEIRALVLWSKTVGRFSTRLPHRSSSRLRLRVGY